MYLFNIIFIVKKQKQGFMGSENNVFQKGTNCPCLFTGI